MAIAQKWLASRYNRPGFEMFDYSIYAVCGDGCMMEGVGSEAASLAGHLGLDNLCWVYDNNHITIEGSTSIAFTEDIAARFLGYGWNVLRVGDANDIDLIEHALGVFHKTKGRPTFIILDSHIGYGSPHKQDTAAAHGEPLGEEEVRLTKRDYGWPEDAKFLVPDGVRAHFAAGIGARGAHARARWTELFAAYRAKYPELATEIDLMQRRELPAGWDRGLPIFPADPKGIAGRDASGKVLNVLAQNIPWLLGGSADLGSSNKTLLTFAGAGDFEPGSFGGRNLHFGIREHAMAAAVNGLSLSKLRAFGATFFIFSDYARPAIRLSSIMELPTMPWGTARMARRTNRWSSSHRSAPNPGWWCCGRRTQTKWSRLIATSCSCGTSPRCWRCRGNRCRHWTAANTRPHPASRAAPMCSPTPRAESPR
jgi:transketolase